MAGEKKQITDLTAATSVAAADVFMLSQGGVTKKFNLPISVDSNGNVGIGTDSPATLLNLVSGGTNTRPQITLNAYNDQSEYSPSLIFKKSNSDTVGTLSETQDDDVLFNIGSFGVNSSSASVAAGQIKFIQDGAAGASYIPAKFEVVLSDGASTNATVATISTSSGLIMENGLITLKETTTPTAEADYGKVYTKSDNKLYFQDGAGAEHEISLAT